MFAFSGKGTFITRHQMKMRLRMRNFLYWVAVAVFAGLVLLSVEYLVFQNEEKLIPEEGSIGDIQPRKKYSPLIRTDVQTKEGKIDNDSLTDSESIRQLLPLALHINRSTDRNSALENLVDSALKISDLPLAAEITSSINSSTHRNRVYSRIIDKAISREEFKTAESVARKINSSVSRNSQIRKIIQARSDRLRK